MKRKYITIRHEVTPLRLCLPIGVKQEIVGLDKALVLGLSLASKTTFATKTPNYKFRLSDVFPDIKRRGVQWAGQGGFLFFTLLQIIDIE